MANIILDHGPPPANPVKGGEDYDRCPRDGCLEVSPEFRAGGRSPKGAEHFLWNIFSADARKGGCGASWTRTGAQRHARNQRVGMPTQYVTGSVARGAVTSVPSRTYQDNFEQIDWGK